MHKLDTDAPLTLGQAGRLVSALDDLVEEAKQAADYDPRTTLNHQLNDVRRLSALARRREWRDLADELTDEQISTIEDLEPRRL